MARFASVGVVEDHVSTSIVINGVVVSCSNGVAAAFPRLSWIEDKMDLKLEWSSSFGKCLGPEKTLQRGTVAT